MSIYKKRYNLWLLLLGFLSLISIQFLNGSFIVMMSTFLWLMIFQHFYAVVSCRKDKWITGLVFLSGFIIRAYGFTGMLLTNIAVLGGIGLLIIYIFVIHARCYKFIKGLFYPLVLPMLWMAGYGIVTLIRIPSAMRLDWLFFDNKVIIQMDRMMGSALFTFMIVWFSSLLSYFIRVVSSKKDRRIRKIPAFISLILSVVMLLSTFIIGSISVFTRKDPDFYVKCAYATGPYVGNFMDYVDLSPEEYIKSFNHAVKEAAYNGAKLLVFNEESFGIKDREEEVLLDNAKEMAKLYGIHILYGLDIADTDESHGGKSINKLVFVDKSGEVLSKYVKYQLIPILESDYVRGEGKIPCLSVNFGEETVNLAFGICYDSNFPHYLSQVKDQAELLLLPSWDWKGITRLHYRICGSIGPEQKLTVLKPTYDGITIAADPYGRVLQFSDTGEDGFETVHILSLPIWKK